MTILAEQYIEQYVKEKKLNIRNENDREQAKIVLLLKSKREQIAYLKQHGFPIQYLLAFQRELRKKIARMVFIGEIFEKTVEKLYLEKLNVEDEEKLLESIQTAETILTVEKYPIQKEEMQIIKALVEKEIETDISMKNKEVKEKMKEENTDLTVVNTEKITKVIKETLNQYQPSQIDEENYQTLLQKAIKNLDSQNPQDMEMLKRTLEDELRKWTFYRKMIQLFATLDWDHLTNQKREEVLFQIKRGEFFTKDDQSKFNMTQQEFDTIINTILEKFGYDKTYEIVPIEEAKEEEQVIEQEQIQEKFAPYMQDYQEKLNNIPNDQLMAEYEKIKQAAKEDYGWNDLTDEEFNELKEYLLDMVLDVIAQNIAEDLGLYQATKEIETVEEEFHQWTEEDYKRYDLPESLRPEIEKRVEEKIEEEKEYRKEKQSTTDNVLDIGEEFVVTEKIPKYTNIDEFCDQPETKKQVKKGKKGIVIGYALSHPENPKDRIEVASKQELEEALIDGFELKGYIADIGYFHNNECFIPIDKVEKQEEKKKKPIFQKIKANAVKIGLGALALIAALTGLKACSNKNKQPNNEKNIQIEEIKTKPIVIENPKTEKPVIVENPELDPEIQAQLEEIPSFEADYTIKEGARISDSAQNIDVKELKMYHRADLERKQDGIVLESPNKERKVFTDTDEILTALNNGYKYIGARAINEYSYDSNGNVVEWEGYFGKDDIIVEKEKTLGRVLKP